MNQKKLKRMPFFTSRDYLDFDEFEEAIRSWQLEILRLDNRPTKNMLTQFDTGDVLVSHALFTGQTHQKGDPPKGLLTCAILADPQSQLVWRKKEISPNSMMIFHPGTEIDSVTRGKKVEVFTFSFPVDFINRFASKAKSRDGENLLGGHDLVEIPLFLITELRKSTSRALSILRQNAILIENKHIQNSLNADLSQNLHNCLSFRIRQKNTRFVAKRGRVWQLIEDYIEANNQRLLSVAEVAGAVGVSESTLLRMFKERFGISPKAYLNFHRLNAARKILQRSDARKGKIIEAANALGFWHMGQFASDYRRLFGELPSQTVVNLNLLDRN